MKRSGMRHTLRRLVRLSESDFTWSNSGRCCMVPDPCSPPADLTVKQWTLDPEWAVVGISTNPPLQPGMKHGCYVGVMYENKSTFERAWFHWHKRHLGMLPNAPEHLPPASGGKVPPVVGAFDRTTKGDGQ